MSSRRSSSALSAWTSPALPSTSARRGTSYAPPASRYSRSARTAGKTTATRSSGGENIYEADVAPVVAVAVAAFVVVRYCCSQR